MSHLGKRPVALMVAGAATLAIVLLLMRGWTDQGSPESTAGPDLSGVWDLPGSAQADDAAFANHRVPYARVVPGSIQREEPSMTPWAMEIFKRNREGITDPVENGRKELDPSEWCFPHGPSRMYTSTKPFEILQRQQEVTIRFERDHLVRRVYTDGREHPEGFPISWRGHSIGKWEGDALVVDTVYINPVTWIDGLGYPKSDEMRMVERFRLVTPDTLDLDITFHDPKAYTKPWTESMNFERKPGYEIKEHFECEDLLEMGKYRPSE